MATSFSMWLGIIALKHKLGENDPDVKVVEDCVRGDRKDTPELRAAVERIRGKLIQGGNRNGNQAI